MNITMNQNADYGNWVPQKVLRAGISEIHYIGSVEKRTDFVPKYAHMPWMISCVGILYGIK